MRGQALYLHEGGFQLAAVLLRSALGSHCRTRNSCFAVEWGKSSGLCAPQRHLLLVRLKGIIFQKS